MQRRRHRSPRLAETSARVSHAAGILKALGHPIRLRIVAVLCHGEEHVTGLATRLSTPQVIISQQLRVLRTHGLVKATRAEGRVFYQLAIPGLVSLIQCVEHCTEDCRAS